MTNQPSAVLFTCTQNAIRSPMAEGLLKRLSPQGIYVDSVGVRTLDTEADPFAVEVMAELGIDISHHHPKTFAQLDDSSFDLVISLSPEAQHRAVEMVRTMACEVEYWQTLDPTIYEGPRDVMLDAYRRVRDGLAERIRKRFGLGLPAR
mgnify:CR=1 FL=1